MYVSKSLMRFSTMRAWRFGNYGHARILGNFNIILFLDFETPDTSEEFEYVNNCCVSESLEVWDMLRSWVN